MRRIQLSALLCVSVFVLSLSGCSLFRKGGSGAAGDGSDSALSEADLNAQREGRFGSGSIPAAEGEGIFRDINFDYDSSVISAAGRQDIELNAQLLRDNPEVKVTLEGHTDDRGTNEYNMALGAARARAAADVLTSLGISRSRIETISYGEETPLDTSETEAGWAKNRRVHFSGYRTTP